MIRAATLTSPRLQRVLALLSDGRPHTTRDIVRRALDDISADGQQVAPTCPYVATWIRRHPEYAPLVAGSLGES